MLCRQWCSFVKRQWLLAAVERLVRRANQATFVHEAAVGVLVVTVVAATGAVKAAESAGVSMRCWPVMMAHMRVAALDGCARRRNKVLPHRGAGARGAESPHLRWGHLLRGRGLREYGPPSRRMCCRRWKVLLSHRAWVCGAINCAVTLHFV